MTPEQLQAMIARRGYASEREGERLIVARHGIPTYPLRVADFAHLNTADAATFLDRVLGHNQRHRQHRCGEPLLEAVTSSNPRATYDTTCWYEYRAAAAGPESVPIAVCPRCRGALSLETIGMIVDE